ncbi:MAG: phosphatase PAP2 family protein [Kiritimatiellaceae bacterium]|nr:phosphatase PAP2 family protein [Kiritimatiellaceae bacterium]
MKKRSSLVLILLCMVLAAVLFGSWFRCQEGYNDVKGRPALRYTQQDSFWKAIDSNVFLAMNGTMKDNPVMQTVWGIANHRAFDLVAAAWMGLLFVIYYVRNPRNENRAELIQFGLYMIAALLLVTLASEALIHFHRLSPTETAGLKAQAILLTDLKEHITWSVKVGSSNSFPGDHATVLMFIGSFLIWRLRSWYGWCAAFGIIVFALPRLAGGGHWLSDILVGSLSFYLFFFPLVLFQPVREWILKVLYNPSRWICRNLPFSGADGQNH